MKLPTFFDWTISRRFGSESGDESSINYAAAFKGGTFPILDARIENRKREIVSLGIDFSYWQPLDDADFSLQVNPTDDPHIHIPVKVHVSPDGSVKFLGKGSPWKDTPSGRTVLEGVQLGASLYGAWNAIGSLAETGASIMAPQGAQMDYFDSFGFTSGEPDLFIGDASEVDFGFGNPTYDLGDVSPATTSWDVAPDAGFESDQILNGTPEVTTNAFGTNFDPTFGVDVQPITDAVKLAKTGAQFVKPATGKAASSGANSAKAASGTNDILGTFADVLAGASQVAQALSGTDAQKTTAVNRKPVGQLTSANAATSMFGGASPMLLAGIALLAVAFYLKKG